jgi:hypothetical protein
MTTSAYIFHRQRISFEIVKSRLIIMSPHYFIIIWIYDNFEYQKFFERCYA